MDWITNNIAIGNYLDASVDDLAFQVDAVLCLKENCCNEDRTDVDVLCVPLIDGSGNNPRDIREAVQYVRDIISANERILVHCHAGRSRSVAIVARYLTETTGISRQAALDLISSKREIYLSDGIDEIFG